MLYFTYLCSLDVPPSKGKFKLNTDGCCKGNLDFSTGATILRNDKGNVVLAGCETHGHNTNLVTELRAMIMGLKLYLQHGFCYIIVESNCMVLINLL